MAKPPHKKDDAILFCTPNSPFSRLARIALIELELSEEIAVEFVTVRDPKSELLNITPLGKVPTLQLNQNVFYDTRLIVSQLQSYSGRDYLLASPNDPEQLAFEGFCLGFLESLSVWIREARRPADMISQELLAVERARAIRCLPYLEEQINQCNSPRLGHYAVACGLELAESRLEINWGDHAPILRAQMDGLFDRPSMQATRFHPA